MLTHSLIIICTLIPFLIANPPPLTVRLPPPLPRVRSIRLAEQYLYPWSMRIEETCFGNSLAEVGSGDLVRVVASRPFSLFLTTEFTDSYYNLQQYYGESLEDITVNTLMLSKELSSQGD